MKQRASLVVFPVTFQIAAFLIAILAGTPARAHDVITTKITFDREIARIVYARCGSCHRPGGTAFSLMTYDEARPWAKAIQEEVLERRMPPWGAVKGFDDFRNDQALTPEQIEVIADWVEGGAPEGEPKDLPAPPKFSSPPAADRLAGAVSLSGDDKLQHSIVLGGLFPKKVEPGASFQITAELPDGHIEPLLWLQPFKPAYGHAFWLRTPLKLPRGTVIHGLAAGSIILLLPAP
jgi:mono/diheme cytochrome c family protein